MGPTLRPRRCQAPGAPTLPSLNRRLRKPLALFATALVAIASAQEAPREPGDIDLGPRLTTPTALGEFTLGAGDMDVNDRNNSLRADLEVGYVLRHRTDDLLPRVYELEPLYIQRVASADENLDLTAGVGGGFRITTRRETERRAWFLRGVILQPSEQGAHTDRPDDTIYSIGAGVEFLIDHRATPADLSRIAPAPTIPIHITLDPAAAALLESPRRAGDARAHIIAAYLHAALHRTGDHAGPATAFVHAPAPGDTLPIDARTLIADLGLFLTREEQATLADTGTHPPGSPERLAILQRTIEPRLIAALRGPRPLTLFVPGDSTLRIVTIRPQAAPADRRAPTSLDSDLIIEDFLSRF